MKKGGDTDRGLEQRWRRKSGGHAVRKILVATRLLREIYVASLVSAIMAAAGGAIYILVFPSSVVLVEALVWLIEAISFTSLAVAFKIAASRTVYYRARFEILRIEALAALHVALIGLFLTAFIVLKSILRPQGEATPMILSSYPLLSAVFSFLLEKRLHSRLRSLEIRLASLRLVAEKLRLDVILEAAGGLSIILANMTGIVAFEAAIVAAVGAYVMYGLGSIAVHNILYLVGPGPQAERDRVRRSISTVLGSLGYKPRTVRVESYGTFAEAEVWVEYPHDASLRSAYETSRLIARRLVAEVPELLRAIVIMVPVRLRRIKRYRREEVKLEAERESGSSP